MKEREEAGTDGLLFTDRQGVALKYNAVQSAFNAGFKALGLPVEVNLYPAAFLRYSGFDSDQGFVDGASEPWPHFKSYDGKVCQGGGFAEQRDSGENRKSL